MPIILDGSAGVTYPVTAGGTSAVQASSAKVLQVISATKVDAFTTTSATPVDVTGLTLNITPTSTSSKILILAQIYGGGDAATAIYLNIVRNSTALGQGTAGTLYNSTSGSFFNNANLYATYPLLFLDSPNTTSSTTYKIQTFVPTGSIAINKRVSDSVVGGSSTITVMEIAG